MRYTAVRSKEHTFEPNFLTVQYSFVVIGNQQVEGIRVEDISSFFPRFSCAGIFPNDLKAIEYITKFKPHLVIFNVDSEPVENEITCNVVAEMFQYLDTIPYFIALNNSSEFAFKAIQSGFSDYLTRSDIHSLGKSLARFEKRTPFPLQHSLCIRLYNDFHILKFRDIIYLKADNNSTDFRMINGENITAYKTLKHFENNLPANFIRIHRSYIVNIQFVSRIQISKSKCFLNSNEQLPFSNSYRDSVDALLLRNGISF